jgi:hypothetical protein
MAFTGPTMITNATGTQNILSNLRVVDFADKIFLLQPEAAPLYVLVSKLNKRPAINTTIEWPENDLNPSWSSAAASAGSADTEITMAAGEGDYFNKYDLVKIPSTGEVILVTATSTCAVTAIRGYAGSTAASAAANATMVIIGSAFEEGSTSTALYTKSRQASRVFNYLQIFRKSVEVTNTMLNSELYGGDIRAYERKVKGIELMRDLERTFLFGWRNEDTAAANLDQDHARRTTGGADFFISTNTTAVGGILTETDFEAFIRTVTRFGGEEVYLFCAPLIISTISQWAQGKLNMYPKDKTYGIAINQYLSPHGTINLVKDYMLENAGSVSNTSLYGGYAFALKLDDMVYRYLQNRDVTMEADIQHPGDDFVKDQYICEVGMEFHNQEKHGMLTGVTG